MLFSLADLSRLRLPVPAHCRRSRALVSQPCGTSCGGRPRGHLPDDAPVGARREPGRRRRAGGRSRAANAALHVHGPAQDRAPARVRCGRPVPPAPQGPALRRSPHGLVSILLRARGGARAAPRSLRARRRLARTVELRVLARVSRRGRAGVSGTRAAPLHARAPARPLLFAADRGPPAGGRPARGGNQLEGEYAGDARAADGTEREPLVVFAGRHVPDKSVADLAPALAVAMREAPELHGLILGDGPERTRVLRPSRGGLADRVRVPASSRATRSRGARPRPLPRAALPPRGLRARVVEASAHAPPACVRPTTRGRDGRGDGQRTVAPSASPPISPPRSCSAQAAGSALTAACSQPPSALAHSSLLS